MSERLALFLKALERADANELCSPPGLGGLWRVKHVRSGLARRVLVEYEGIIAFARNPRHGACESCRGRKGSQPCDHCNCSTCVWEHEADERGGRLADPAKVRALVRRMQAFSFEGPKRPALTDEI